jgi:hypothetical protein
VAFQGRINYTAQSQESSMGADSTHGTMAVNGKKRRNIHVQFLPVEQGWMVEKRSWDLD